MSCMLLQTGTIPVVVVGPSLEGLLVSCMLLTGTVPVVVVRPSFGG